MDIAAITSAYDSLHTQCVTYLIAMEDYKNVSIPSFPPVCFSDSDYNDVVTAQSTARATKAANFAFLEEAKNNQIQAELVLIALMPQSQWIKVTGLENWAEPTQYIAWLITSQSTMIVQIPHSPFPRSVRSRFFLINVLTSEPNNPYPSLT